MADSDRLAFTGMLAALPAGTGGALVVAERTAAGIALVAARGERNGDTLAVLSRLCGIAASDGPGAALGKRVTLLGIGPSRWLLVDASPGPEWPAPLDGYLSGAASVFDQSSAYAILDISGRSAEAVLQKGFFLDLGITGFPVGSCASAGVAQMSATLWRIAPDHFGIAVPRSYAASFWHWLTTTAAATAAQIMRAA